MSFGYVNMICVLEQFYFAQELNLSSLVYFVQLSRLKLEIDFQYMLNVKGSTPAKVIGVDYRTTLKPALKNLEEEMKKSSVSKLEESIALQEQLQDKCKVPDEKKKLLTTLRVRLDEVNFSFMMFFISNCSCQYIMIFFLNEGQ